MQRASSAIQLIQTRIFHAFIQSVFRTSKTLPEKTTFTPLSGGMSQASLFRFTYDKKTYVLRLLPDKASSVERKRQIALMLHASQAGVGPSVFFVSPEMDAVVMEFIDGSTTTLNTFEEDQAIRNFAQLLERLHTSSATVPIANSPFLRFQRFLDNHVMVEPTIVSKMVTAKAIMASIEAAFASHPLPLVPTHLDLHSLNIMQKNDQFLLVDWVNGGLSDPFLDLATFAVFQNLDTARTRLFLETYFRRTLSKTEWTCLHLLLPVRPLVIAAALLHSRSLGSLSNSPLLLKQPSFIDFLQRQSAGTLDWPPQIIGLIMLNHGIALANKSAFQEAVNHLQKQQK